jgi:hypothetical protein
MKRMSFALAVCLVLAAIVAAPAAANQGGISGPVPSEVAALIGMPYLQLWGGNFMPGAAVFPVVSESDPFLVGTAYFRLSRCGGFLGYRINVPGLDSDAALSIRVDGATVVYIDPVSVAGKPTADGLHAEGWITWADVPDAFQISPNPVPGIGWPSVWPLYEALATGDAHVVVAAENGTVTGSMP